MDKVLSIIVPVYNMEKYLHQCLSSVISNVYKGKYEVLVINDGSTDNSLEIAKGFEFKYPEIFRVVDKSNGGYGSCFNVGLENASGKYIKMLDSDDFFNESIFNQFLFLLERRDEDIIINDCIKFDDKKNISIGGYIDNQEKEGTLVSLDTKLLDVLFIHDFSYKKDMLLGCICPNNILYTDNIIYLYAISKAKSFYNSKLPIYFYRVNRIGQSVGQETFKKKYIDLLSVLKCVYEIKLPDIQQGKDAKRIKMLQCISEVSYLPIKSVCSNSLSYKLYKIYKEIIFCLRKWSANNKLKIKDISVLSVAVSMILPAGVSYLLNYTVLHTIKKNVL